VSYCACASAVACSAVAFASVAVALAAAARSRTAFWCPAMVSSELAEALAGVRAAGDAADVLLGGGELGLSRSQRRGGHLGLGLRRAQPLARVVELLGEHLEVVRLRRDEGRRLGRAARVLRRGLGGQRRQQHAQDGGEDQTTAAGAGSERGRHDAAAPIVEMVRTGSSRGARQ
jgi:hypothetical protein